MRSFTLNFLMRSIFNMTRRLIRDIHLCNNILETNIRYTFFEGPTYHCVEGRRSPLTLRFARDIQYFRQWTLQKENIQNVCVCNNEPFIF